MHHSCISDVENIGRVKSALNISEDGIEELHAQHIF